MTFGFGCRYSIQLRYGYIPFLLLGSTDDGQQIRPDASSSDPIADVYA